MIFMGEEMAAATPFPFFVDFEDPHLRQIVDEGRVREYPHHDWSGSLPPSDPRAFEQAKIRPSASDDPGMREWYRALLWQRRRCLASGRLSAERLHVEHDEGTGLIGLTYQDGLGNPCWGVVSRLVPVTTIDWVPIAITVPGN